MRALFLVFVCACAPAPAHLPSGAPGERSIFSDALWDDGNAEIASYRVRADRYGILRDGSAVLITVKERFDAEHCVKDDGPLPAHRAIEVIKLNHVLTLPTGVYTYHQMASAFLTRDRARPIKLVIGSQEWCGVTYKRIAACDGAASLRGSSYFGGEGERVYDLPLGSRSVWADALPVWLRTLDLSRHDPRRVELLRSELNNRVRSPHVDHAEIRVGDPSGIDVPAGHFTAIPVRVRSGSLDTYWLDQRAPHVLVRWERSDGGFYDLEWVRRAPYWRMNGPGDVGSFDQP